MLRSGFQMGVAGALGAAEVPLVFVSRWLGVDRERAAITTITKTAIVSRIRRR